MKEALSNSLSIPLDNLLLWTTYGKGQQSLFSWKATTELHGAYRMSYFLSCCAQMGCRVVYTILLSGIKWTWTQTSCYWLVVTSYAQIRRQFLFFLQNLKGHRWLLSRVNIHWGNLWCNIIKVLHNRISFVSFNFRIQLPIAFPVGLISDLFVVLMFFRLSPVLVNFESLYHSVSLIYCKE